MRLVVADTSPVFYLLSIGQITLLPELFETIFVPASVLKELRHPAATALIHDWANEPPEWVTIRQAEPIDDPALQSLGVGERDAITLALSLQADLILIDERKGTAVALGKGFDVTGTLGVLGLAARKGLVDLADCFARLKRTNFRYRQEIMDELLKRQQRG